MSITINGTTGVSGVDGTAATPAVQGADSNTGVFFPAADTVAISTSSTERMRIDSVGNVGIGVTPFTNTTSFSAGKDPTIANDGSFFGGGLYYDAAWRNTVASQGGWALRNTGGVFTIFTGPANGAAGSAISASERLRIAADGQIGIGGANYGTSGQVLTSGGSGAAPSWTSRGFASATLTDKTSVRANGTTYQNTTTGWLFVSVRDSNNGQAFTAGPSSASLNIFNTNIAPGTAIALVPPSYYYACSGSVLQSWYEGQA